MDLSVFTAVYWKAFFRRFFRIMVFGGSHKIGKYALPILLFYGLAGVLIDLDHFLIKETQMARPLHLPYWFIIWIIIIGYYAYLHRRVFKLGLK